MKNLSTLATVFLGLSGCILFPLSTKAATAEETFAFILFGLEDGTKFVSGSGASYKFVIANKSPLTYEMIVENNGRISFSINQAMPCVFDVAINIGEEEKVDLKVNMNQFIGLEMYPVDVKRRKLKFTSECAIQGVQTKKCLAGSYEPGMIFRLTPDPDRILRGVQYFKENFCAGSPY